MEGLADRRCRVRRHDPLLALFAFLALGIALTVTMLLFIAVPVAVGVALIASLFRPRM